MQEVMASLRRSSVPGWYHPDLPAQLCAFRVAVNAFYSAFYAFYCAIRTSHLSSHLSLAAAARMVTTSGRWMSPYW